MKDSIGRIIDIKIVSVNTLQPGFFASNFVRYQICFKPAAQLWQHLLEQLRRLAEFSTLGILTKNVGDVRSREDIALSTKKSRGEPKSKKGKCRGALKRGQN
ncbi:MAG: hypothetical protein QXR19_08855 [Candidatus Jordarchaeaceae archaeon]